MKIINKILNKKTIFPLIFSIASVSPNYAQREISDYMQYNNKLSSDFKEFMKSRKFENGNYWYINYSNTGEGECAVLSKNRQDETKWDATIYYYENYALKFKIIDKFADGINFGDSYRFAGDSSITAINNTNDLWKPIHPHNYAMIKIMKENQFRSYGELILPEESKNQNE